MGIGDYRSITANTMLGSLHYDDNRTMYPKTISNHSGAYLRFFAHEAVSGPGSVQGSGFRS